jgi:hypothetical protein
MVGQRSLVVGLALGRAPKKRDSGVGMGGVTVAHQILRVSEKRDSRRLRWIVSR